ncbi:sterile alpha motif domain-containing protein 9-like [Callorhinchus milii]|uniref:Sterile alpha motif domain containing 9 like n=1 Tax=Callorhinchus milii TaxID=7868 RepID=A0A4W3KAY8_CALMI|nr:sterile alpha motif domain-containing protein 9-like [Callorhinchus milii]XP_042198441.1 sterile alpha motif domain-containing protein 9-like [Callorhinchus milii]XP_042198442.1 sterile alpha motif domain-containing protein 9-like [Callorhinchus milii]XP_042198443.1 sterile alpha motif domain-containing protein 9-like [Callorhinchus milii]|eukprot:gi/632943421/ref/XP_007886939.1/ PREDICTED: sterile alpha motif domain-containing protein 9-like [Callorhinchus milii]
MEELNKLRLQEWNEDHVKTWLKCIGIKDAHVQVLYEEEVTGAVLEVIDEDFLKNLQLKGGQIKLILKRRNILLNSQRLEIADCSKREGKDGGDFSSVQNKQQKVPTQMPQTKNIVSEVKSKHNITELASDEAESSAASQPTGTSEDQNIVVEHPSSSQCKPYPFGENIIEFKYVRNRVLPPETGVIDLICPCHEYKSLDNAVKLDRLKLQIKFAREVIRFSSGCMNMRTNGTIHFGIMDRQESSAYTHGEIIGVPVKDQDIYVDALDLIDRCFKRYSDDAKLSIRPPRFVEVISRDGGEKRFVIEVDVKPLIDIVRNKIYRVRLPNFSENKNKIEFDKLYRIYRRSGANTEPISEEDQDDFISNVQVRDKIREEAENRKEPGNNLCDDQGRKLKLLLTGGKKYMNNSLWYVIVTNKCRPEDLENLDFLLDIKIFCVFDFDPDSKTDGFCKQYLEHHTANTHFLQDYANDGNSTSDFASRLCLFDQTSWIFCNGRNDFDGDEKPCDVSTWVTSRKKHLKRTVSVICNDILPNGSFVVLFLLLSPIEQPIVDTFHEFYAEMNGRNDIICIAECDKNHQKWANLAQVSCSIETINEMSIVGMKLSHVNDTVKSMQPISKQSGRYLQVSTKAMCLLKTSDEERMSSLEILCVNQCEDYKIDPQDSEWKIKITEIESDFYRGGKVKWLNFFLGEKNFCEDVIQRDAYTDAARIVDGIMVNGQTVKRSVSTVHIFHHSGSGGSTVARQIVWNFRTKLRCAVVKQSYQAAVVCQHAIQLLEYEESDIDQCIPVLLLVEDSDEDYLDKIKQELGFAITCKTDNTMRTFFILLNCRRSHNPEKQCKNRPLETVAVTHKLTQQEKRSFSAKRKQLEKQFEPEFILTFVLLSDEFPKDYIENVVKHFLEGIDHSSLATQLIKYVALLNDYVPNSSISLSHCEAFLGLGPQVNHLRQHCFESSLTDQARLLFIHFNDDSTEIRSVRIVHPLVAKEVLQQLSHQPLSQIAMKLLQEKAFFKHRFARDEFYKSIRNLFLQRHKRSRGDSADTFFSPLIEDIRNKEKTPEKAVEVLTQGYESFGKDPFFAQQLARLQYTQENFSEAILWAEDARKQLPFNSYILDTEGQVYRKKLFLKFDITRCQSEVVTPELLKEPIEIALKAIRCFRAAQRASQSELDSINNSGFVGEVEVGCHLLQLLSLLNIFSKDEDGCYKKLVHYLLGQEIPDEIQKPWRSFHGQLKGLQKGMYEALEWISEDISYFQTDKTDDDEEEKSKIEEHLHNPRKWLTKKASVYARFFACDFAKLEEDLPQEFSSLSPLVRRLQIYKLGGGNVTMILSQLSDQKIARAVQKLEEIISLYSENPQKEKLELTDLINYIMCHITLNCVAPGSPKLVDYRKLRDLSLRFQKEKELNNSNACFLLTLLFWPDEICDKESSSDKEAILKTALTTMKKLYENKIKNVAPRKKRLYTPFFLGNGFGLHKFIHKSTLEKLSDRSLNERRLKWLTGDVWRNPNIIKKLKRVNGWTEKENLFVRGHCKQSKISILPLHFASMPHGNENVTFCLGFTFNGFVAYDIKVKA